MIYKQAQYLLLLVIMLLIFFKADAQNLNEKIYLQEVRLIDTLSFYKMNSYDSLYHISILMRFRNTDYKQDYYGWIIKQSANEISFLNINGKETVIQQKQKTKICFLPVNNMTIDTLNKLDTEQFVQNLGTFARNFELILWLYKKGAIDYSKQLLFKRPALHGDVDIRNGFGALYYDAMLSAYSYERNYSKAIALGEHLSGNSFIGYQYQNEAKALTSQLKNHLEDFKTFRLPDSVQWHSLKQGITREKQILYLADRLRLLNCIQQSQPGGISYDMYQYSVSFTDAGKLNVSYGAEDAKFIVINPFTELLNMRLNPQETVLLLPYLLEDTFIPSYNYHRNFFPERNLHRLTWVIENLIFEITHKNFFNRLEFDSLTSEQKKAVIQKIKNWCDENSTLSEEELTEKELKTASNWTDFHAALLMAVRQKDHILLSIIVQRFNDFNGGSWPSNHGTMAQIMFEHGGKDYINAVKKWSNNTTDNWVELWTSMFLIKYDKNSYESAMDNLESVLKQCDGTTYYPHAMNLLLTLNDKRALKLAEGILSTSRFQMFMNWDYYFNFIKGLLHSKSDYTFNFLAAKLDAYNYAEMNVLHKDNDQILTQNDTFVLTVAQLKTDTPSYYEATTNLSRLEYIKTLNKWFKAQYSLLKQGKLNGLRLDIKQMDAPVTFVDTYSQ